MLLTIRGKMIIAGVAEIPIETTHSHTHTNNNKKKKHHDKLKPSLSSSGPFTGW